MTTSIPGLPRRSLFLGSALLIVLVALVYARTIKYDFTYDDRFRIVRNELVIASDATWWSVLRCFYAPDYPGDLYRPITTATFRLNHLFGGLERSGYHAGNVALHGLVCLLVFALALSFGLEVAPAWCASALFALHPLNVEAVANISGRAELLAAFFLLLAGFCYVAAARRPSQAGVMGLALLSAALLFLAILSKESGAVGLLLLPLLAWGQKIDLRRQRIALLCLFNAAAVALLLRAEILGADFFPERPNYFVAVNPLLSTAVPAYERIIPAFTVLGHYLMLFFAPVALSADYSQGRTLFWQEVFSAVGCARVLCLGAWLGVLWFWRGKSFFVFGVWTLAAFALTCNLLIPIGTIMGERLAYLPLVGFCLFISAVLFAAQLPTRWKYFTAFVAIGLFAWRTADRIPVWRNNHILFIQMALDAPESPQAMEQIGRYWYLVRGDEERARFFFERALSLEPQSINVMRFLIDINNHQGRYEASAQLARALLAITPDDEAVRKVLESGADRT